MLPELALGPFKKKHMARMTTKLDLKSALRRKEAQRRAYAKLSVGEKLDLLDKLHRNLVWMTNTIRPIIDGEVFYYTNLKPDRTGLRHVIWVPDPVAKDGHLRVQLRAGSPSRLNSAMRVSIKRPRIMGMSEADTDRIKRFIAANREALLAHRSGEIDSFELVLRIKKLS